MISERKRPRGYEKGEADKEMEKEKEKDQELESLPYLPSNNPKYTKLGLRYSTLRTQQPLRHFQIFDRERN
jgi:hypothetical protein